MINFLLLRWSRTRLSPLRRHCASRPLLFPFAPPDSGSSPVGYSWVIGVSSASLQTARSELASAEAIFRSFLIFLLYWVVRPIQLVYSVLTQVARLTHLILACRRVSSPSGIELIQTAFWRRKRCSLPFASFLLFKSWIGWILLCFARRSLLPAKGKFERGS